MTFFYDQGNRITDSIKVKEVIKVIITVIVTPIALVVGVTIAIIYNHFLSSPANQLTNKLNNYRTKNITSLAEIMK